MKQINKQFVCVGLAAAGVLAGCSRATVAEMNQSPNFAAATGEVRVKEERNGNSAVRVEVEHLPPTVTPGSGIQTYVVWAQDDYGGQPANLGALEVNEKRKGVLQAVTPLQHFNIFVTTEIQPAATAPTGERVLWASVARD